MSAFAGRYVFVAGLHRTGTSLLARMLAAHPEVSAIEGAPVPENEGCYLQGAIPHTALHGRPGHFATDPAQHYCEDSIFNRLDVRQRIEVDWERWFGMGGTWRVEKSPVNLTRMRLYQQLFPTAQFVVVLRHPQVMAAALAKWVDDCPTRLVDYALEAYSRVFEDLEYLHAAMIVRYEDLVAGRIFPALLAFLDLPPIATPVALRNGNEDYLELATMSAMHARRACAYGYLPDRRVAQFETIIRHPLREVREATQLALVSAAGSTS